jgi:hypothetical protein
MKAINFPLTIVLLVFAFFYGCDNPPSIKLGSGCQLMGPVKSWWVKSYVRGGSYLPAVLYERCSDHSGVTQPTINHNNSKYYTGEGTSNFSCSGSSVVVYTHHSWVYEEADSVQIDCKLK